MGDLKNSCKGRIRPSFRVDATDTPWPSGSYALRKSVRPSSLASLAVFHRISTGAHVSRFRHSIPNEMAPLAISRIQKIQRQPIDSPIKPAQIGPATGPTSGPKLQIDVAIPRCSTGNRSAMRPAPRVMQPQPPIPHKNRNTMRDSMLGARAHPTSQTTKNQLAKLSTILRP